MALIVWTPNLRPFGVYHRQTPDGRTACGLVTPSAYGYTVPLGEALALSDEPCGLCFDAPRPELPHHHRQCPVVRRPYNGQS